jgi:hypothetical protein
MNAGTLPNNQRLSIIGKRFVGGYVVVSIIQRARTFSLRRRPIFLVRAPHYNR